ncbi:hypothetical protein C7445_10927 [Alicyclobacillus sacchari]|uniref:TrkA family protein n=2 Tax=Alicyclobacillus sacchari TaxID=392010 RepID=A0A4R8LMI9_9BACL|nr:hypothetical protein C7445_10927 [Alicyclobacillus sacchari]
MVQNMLVATCSEEDRLLIDRALGAGIDVRVLTCFDDVHHKVRAWYPNRTIGVPAHKATVKAAVQSAKLDIAIVREMHDVIRSALLIQTLREAGVPQIIVMCKDESRAQMYRRCGANNVVVVDPHEEAWDRIMPYLHLHVSA